MKLNSSLIRMKTVRFLICLFAANAALTTAIAADVPVIAEHKTVIANPEATNSGTGYRLQVKVTDTKGQPVSDALVECYRYANWLEEDVSTPMRLDKRGTTGPSGLVSFSITNRASLAIAATKPGLSVGWNGWYPQSETEMASLEIPLTSPLSASGVVRGAAAQPIADAEVWVRLAALSDRRSSAGQPWSVLSSYQGRQLLGTRTGADGRFTIERLPVGATFELAAAKPGLAMDQPGRASIGLDGLTYRSGETNIVLTLKPAGAIEGRVVEEETGKPIAGARIFSMDSGQSAPQSARPTAADGIFRLTDLTPGPRALRATIGTNQFADWVCEPVSVNVESGVTNRDAKITASRGGVLEVTVVDESTGKAIKDASVSASSQSAMGGAARTGTDGIARVRLTPGSVYVFVSKQGLKSSQEQTSIELGRTNRLSISLGKASSLTGTVLDAEGNPASGMFVGLFPYMRGEKMTDAKGQFILPLDPDTFRLGGRPDFQRSLIARDIQRNVVAMLDLAEDATNATLRLGPALTLAGRVTTTASQPITNATVQLMLRTERIGASLGTPVNADATGRFEITGLPPGRRYDVTVQARDYGTETTQVEAAETNRLRIELEPIQLPEANLPLAGVVLDADDKPAAGAMINSYAMKQPRLNGQTDAQGRFSFDHVCAGPIQLSARTQLGNLYGNAMAEGGDTNVTIQLRPQNFATLRPTQKFTGTVVGPDQQTAAKVAVSLIPYSGQGERTTDAQGRFTLMSDPRRYAGMQRNQNTMIARDLGRNLAAAVELLDDQSTNIQVQLEPALTLAGRVVGPDGKAITTAQAQMMFRTDRMTSPLGNPIRADSDGRFEIKALPVGHRYYVTVSAAGFGEEQRSVDSPEGETNRMELEVFELPAADQQIAGLVMDANDKPASGAYVSARGPKQPSLQTQTDRRGHFAFNQVCAGLIQLSANDPYRRGYGSTSASGGDTNIVIRLGSLPSRRSTPPPAALKGRSLPDLTSYGLAVADAPADRPVLVVLIDAEQRPSRRALRLLADRAAALKEKGLAVVALQSGVMAEADFAAWKEETKLPFPVGCSKADPERSRAAWGSTALPWLVLADKNHQVVSEGFVLEDLDAQLETLIK